MATVSIFLFGGFCVLQFTIDSLEIRKHLIPGTQTKQVKEPVCGRHCENERAQTRGFISVAVAT